jgi:hypothetical protein
MATEPRTREDLGSFADIAAAASRSTGLTDFGGTAHEEGFGILCEDMAESMSLTPQGNYMYRQMIKSALTARLIAENSFSENPGYRDVEINRPVFVTGVPRSGTTALHRLLNADPTAQGLELWLTDVPMPRPPRDTWDENPIYTGLNQLYAQHHDADAELAGIHYMDAASVEECWRLLQQQGKSMSFQSLADVPAYAYWLRTSDWTDAYERHRRNLQLIGINDQDKRWVLKNPSHMAALDAIMAVYPDALVIQTHRDPVVAVASACSLSAHATKGWSTNYVGETIGRTQLEMLGEEYRSFAAARAKYPAAQFHDVDYHDFIADPIPTVQGIYAAFELDYTEAADEAIRADYAASQSGVRAPKHSYSLSDYGLTEEQVREAFPA